MLVWSDLSMGDRLKFLRGDLTQAELAEATGLSVWTVRNIEQDRPGRSASLTTLMKLATALGTDVAVLTGQRSPNRRESVDDRRALTAIADSLNTPSDFPEVRGLGRLMPDREPPDLDVLAALVHGAWASYWSGNFPELGVRVPAIIAEGKLAADAYSGEQRERAFRILTDAYQIAADVANQLGDQRIAFTALNRAFPAARSAGDELLLANLSGTLSWVYLRRGRLDEAENVARVTAEDIEPSFGKARPAHLAVWGNLVISAAVAASRSGLAGKDEAAREYLSMAHAAAQRIGHDTNFYETTFGPTQAQIQSVGVAVATKDIGRALDIAKHLRLPESLPTAAKARYLLDVAHAQLLARRDNSATETLLNIRSFAPDWMRHQSLAIHVIEELYGREKQTSALRKLAHSVGLVHE
jgi:transcriptional regulator with XRE-family HTH domain